LITLDRPILIFVRYWHSVCKRIASSFGPAVIHTLQTKPVWFHQG